MNAKYIRLADILRELIASRPQAGTFKLPTELELCQKYNISRQTVRRALSILEEEHLIERRQGSGVYATGLLADSSRNRVAILVSSDTEYIYPALLADLKAAFQTNNYIVSIYVTNHDIQRERTILKELLTLPIRGVLAEGVKTAFPNPNLDLYEHLQAKGTSVLFLHNYYVDYSEAVYVMDDNVTGGYMLGKYLIEGKHTKLAALFNADELQGLRRYHGLQMAIRGQADLLTDSHLTWFHISEVNGLREKQDTSFLIDFIQKKLGDCTAVVCHNDEIAYWLIKELIYAKIRVPEDVSVVSFDNSYLTELSKISITSLTHKPHEVGTTAADCLIRMMHGLPVTAQKIPWQITARGSSKHHS